MTNMQIWRVLIDTGLLASLLYFAHRFLKSQAPAVNSQELQSLNASLKAAVREADDATRNLSEQLTQRKQSLEKILFDLETVEHRVNRAISTAEERKGELEFSIKKSMQNVAEESGYTRGNSNEATLQNKVERKVQPKVYQEQIETFEAIEPPEPEFEESVQPTRTNKPSKSSQAGENIFGEPIGESRAPVKTAKAIPQTYKKLSENIEKEVQEVLPEVEPSVEQGLEEIYSAAEELLRAGKSLEFISSTTKLSVDEVRLLSQMLEQEEKARELVVEDLTEVVKPQDKDSRLGVLGGMKRQVQIL